MAAQHAATEWASGSLGEGVHLEGLVLVPDAPGRLPKELRHLAQVVGGGVPRVWMLPWVESWRYGPHHPDNHLPKPFHSLLADLQLSHLAPK